MRSFAAVMMDRMGELGIRPAELSRRSGVTEQYLSKLRRGKVDDPTWTKACAIIDALEMSREEFAARQLEE